MKIDQRIMKVFLIIFCLSVCWQTSLQQIGLGKLKNVLRWKQITYNISGYELTSDRQSWPTRLVLSDNKITWSFPEENKSTPDIPPKKQFFIQYNNIPFGIDKYNSRMFVSIPRRKHGIPATLNYVRMLSRDSSEDDESLTSSPGLRPYPDLESNDLGSEHPLVSVYRTRVDVCNRLWMVDTGMIETPGEQQIIQPPSIVIFDLKTNKLIYRHELENFSQNVFPQDSSGYASITVDVTKRDCDNAFAYLPDLLFNGLVVFSLKNKRAWRVQHNLFYLDPEEGNFDLNGLQWQWNDGIFSVALGPVQNNGFRLAYFHAMASHKERVVSTKVLRDETLATRRFHGDDFRTLGSRGPDAQSTMHAVHAKTGVMLSAQIGRNALVCWDTQRPFNRKNTATLAKDDELFMYPADLKVYKDDDYFWTLTNKFPIYFYDSLNKNEYNFHVYKAKIEDAIEGTVCSFGNPKKLKHKGGSKANNSGAEDQD